MDLHPTNAADLYQESKVPMTGSHYAVLCAELEAHGRTTYAALMEQYSAHGYTYAGFTRAAHIARQRKIAAPPEGKHSAIVVAGVCPCCGRRTGR